MKTTVDALTKAMLALSRAEREIVAERLVESLVESIDPEVTRAQLVEVRRRRQEIVSGKVRGIPGEQVMREIRAMLE